MGRDQYIVYEENTPWSWWVSALVWGSFLAGAVPVAVAVLGRIADGISPGELPALLMLAGGGFLLLLGPWMTQVLVGRLHVRVTRTSLLIQLGVLPILSKLIPFDEIDWLEPVRYRPMRDFGGWGIRFGKDKRAWTIRGDAAVLLHMKDGPDVYLGSDDPEKLAQRIRSAAAGRFDGRGE
jgi:hypothetical protein